MEREREKERDCRPVRIGRWDCDPRGLPTARRARHPYTFKYPTRRFSPPGTRILLTLPTPYFSDGANVVSDMCSRGRTESGIFVEIEIFIRSGQIDGLCMYRYDSIDTSLDRWIATTFLISR